MTSWYYSKDVNVSSLTVNSALGTMDVSAVPSMSDTKYPDVYFDTSIDGNYYSYPLNFDPKNAEIFQIRVKMNNLTSGAYTNAGGSTVTVAPYLILQYFVDGETNVYTATKSAAKIDAAHLTDGEYVTLTAELNDTFRGHADIDKIRVYFGGVESISAQKQKVSSPFLLKKWKNKT